MLQLTDGKVVEALGGTTTLSSANLLTSAQTVSNAVEWQNWYPYSTVYWQSYPVYVCTDKTKKAIEVLQALEADGLKVQSVKKFIALVEKIAGIL